MDRAKRPTARRRADRPVAVRVLGLTGLVDLGPRRQRAVVAALALNHPAAVSAERLVGMVWGDAPPTSGVGVVHSYVHRLRKQLTPFGAIANTPQGYRLELPETDLDLTLAARLATRAKEAADRGACTEAGELLREAIALWCGEPLADLPGDYFAEHRARLAAWRDTLVLDRIDLDVRSGQGGDVVPELTALVRDQPLREDLRTRLITALLHSGRQADALVVYEDARRTLAEELGVDPGPELRALHAKVLTEDAENAEAARPVVTPAQLPADVHDFTGRAADCAALAEVLVTDAGTPPVAVLFGPGGVGKTALAVHVGHRVRGNFPDGQVFLRELGADPGTALFGLLRDLGLAPEDIPASVAERSARLRTVLAHRRVLLVLDDVSDVSTVRHLLPGAGSSAVLITSRTPLAALAGVAVELRLGMLDEATSRSLFAAVARTDADPGEVLAVCGGLPLAIRVAGARLAARPDWTVGSLARRLRDHRRRLDELAIGDVSVRASVALSYAALSDGAALVLRSFGRCPVPTLAPDAVFALLGLDQAAAEPLLDELVSACLLDVEGRRYRVHDLIHLFAAEVAGAQETEAVQRLHEWFLRSAAAAARILGPQRRHPEVGAGPSMRFRGHNDALAWLATELPTLTAVVAQAAELASWTVAWQLAVELFDIALLRNEWAAVLPSQQLGVEAARESGDRDAQAWTLNHLAGMYQQLGRHEEALSSLHSAREINAVRGDRKSEGTNWFNIAMTLNSSGKTDEALTTFDEARRIHAEIGYRVGEGLALSALADLHRSKGEIDLAIARSREALAVQHESGDEQGAAATTIVLAESLLDAAEPQEALTQAESAIAVATELGHRHLEAEGHRVAGLSLRDLGRGERAREQWERARTILAGIGHPDAEAVAGLLEG